MNSEREVLARTIDILKTHPQCSVYRITNIPGFPDLLANVNGHFVALEVKLDSRGSYGVTKAQMLRLRKIMNNGGIGCVIDKHNVEGLQSFLDRLCDSVNQGESYGM